MHLARKTISAFIPFAILLLSCSPAGPRAPGQSSSSPAQPAAPKILTMGHLREPATIDGYTGEGGGSGGADMYTLLQDKLTVTDPAGVRQPQLATEVPSIDKGTWQILPDGRMTMTWHLRQGVKWHDGAPFTSDDLMFSFKLHKDPDLVHSQAAIARLMDSATNPDPYTFIVTWKSIYVKADEAPALAPNPKHSLEDLYNNDKSGFINSPKYRDEYIGLGPYRMTAWERGTSMDLARFDDYWQGRPPLDRIQIRFIFDANTLVANVLAGAIDMNVPPGITGEQASEVKRRWEGTGNTARIEAVPTLDYMEPMVRLDYAKPVNGMPQLAVRQAMVHGIDKAALTGVVTNGLGPVADSIWFPNDALFPQLESAFVKYPYDVTKAQQLLAQAGWTKGPDGILVHTSGERFDVEIMVNETLAGKTGTIIADDWKKLGINATANPIPPARADDRAYTATRSGPLATFSFGDWSSDRLNGRDLAGPENRFAGRNRAGYQNPRSDALLDQLLVTIDPAKRLPLLREQAQIYSGDAIVMSLYWEVRNVLALKNIKGYSGPASPWFNPYAWDKE